MTAVVAVGPVVAAWLLRADGVISSPWLCALVAVGISLTAATVGSALWKRSASAGDLMFNELLVWGWVRRLRIERRFANAIEALDVAEMGEPAAATLTPVERWQALGRLALAVEALDAYTIGHSRRVARHAERIARELGLPDEQVRRIRAAAAVHDVGKVFTPRAILNKPSALTPEEYEEVKQHCDDGATIVACLDDPELTAIVRHHHERLDGTGYPGGLAGEAIPIGARIVAVADTYDAIIEIRPYRKPASHKYAITVLREEQGAHLDPAVVEAFVNGYAGRRALVLWTVLAVLPQRIVAFGTRSGSHGAAAGAASGTGPLGAASALRRPASTSQRAASGAVAGALLAASFAAGSATLPKLHRRPPPPARVQATVNHHAPVHHRRASHHHVLAAAKPVSSTCLAYNPQLCSVISVGGSGGRTGAATGRSGAGSRATTATLPFTGIDPRVLALFGILLLLAGALLRASALPDRFLRGCRRSAQRGR